jgi:hypothetical protein
MFLDLNGFRSGALDQEAKLFLASFADMTFMMPPQIKGLK